ncbi:MAG: prepilin-type N-terminal cleavage/methylation domain-containing protein [bacterium]|nr:prepilin-type N-terminal cleavage/methylation domain-containing protein [bacterium]
MFKKSRKGFTLVEIMIVVAIIGILISIAVPGFVKARNESRTKACQENLSKIEGAKEQWAMEKNIAAGTACTIASDLVGADSYLKKTPVCPENGTYDATTVGADSTCSIGGNHVLQ